MSIGFLMNRQAKQVLSDGYKKAYEKACKDRDKYKKALENIKGCGLYCTSGICPASKIAKQELEK